MHPKASAQMPGRGPNPLPEPSLPPQRGRGRLVLGGRASQAELHTSKCTTIVPAWGVITLRDTAPQCSSGAVFQAPVARHHPSLARAVQCSHVFQPFCYAEDSLVLVVSNAQPSRRRHCSVTQTSFAGACFLARFGHKNQHARQPRSTPAHRHRWHYT